MVRVAVARDGRTVQAKHAHAEADGAWVREGEGEGGSENGEKRGQKADFSAGAGLRSTHKLLCAT